MLTPNQIRGRLLTKGIKIVDIANRFSVSPTTVSVVLNRWGTSKRIQQYIAEILGMNFKEVWDNHSATADRHRKAA